MKVVFMGTPDFAVEALKSVIQAGHEVVCVVTQPDKPKGRGKEMQFTPVKQCALEHQITVLQPVKVREAESVEALRAFDADIFIVAAFGQILPKELLTMPKYGCVNIHASLLPKYRGAAPIQWAVINGEKESGVTIQQMGEGVDTGDILLKREIALDPKETGESLYDKLSRLGAELIVEVLPEIEAGKVVPEKQDEALSTHVGKITKAMGLIDWNKSAGELERLVRGLNSWPSAYTFLRGKTLKIWEAEVLEEKEDGEPGSVDAVTKTNVIVNTGEGKLALTSVQLEGKKRMEVKDFLLGYKVEAGEKLGK
ncbi:MAG: methionyl-tRNA formyltransferase [Lachnospiraceae bacterium]|nr:methionyl-tRNA formyltransferase [Lachnospiraceae bacterium]